MNASLTVAVVSSLVWLLLMGSAFASYRLGWGKTIKLALTWVAIFAGLYLVVEWFMIAQGTASSLM
ncbi:hypothetical protein [Erythrobacter donghaensis]|jgi:hypothetical protein|uniref:hypothetical protein n=1 Tax=Erythrobacter donghaensis TaxID=267135 RepID=UPI00093F2558|nr:hypothetical protein [Erythrobacter donghaensis]